MKGAIKYDRSFGADDHRVGWREAIERRRKGSLVSLCVRQDGRKLTFDAAGIGLPKADNTLGDAKDLGQKRNLISSQVQKRTAGQFGIEDAMIARKILAIVGIDGLDFADGLGFEQLAKHIKFWEIERPKRFGKKPFFTASQFDHFQSLGLVESDGLLHKYVLARIKCQRDTLTMRIVRGGNVDDVQVASCEKRPVVAIGVLEPHARGEFLGAASVPGTDGNDVLPGMGTHRLNKPLGDPARHRRAATLR